MLACESPVSVVPVLLWQPWGCAGCSAHNWRWDMWAILCHQLPAPLNNASSSSEIVRNHFHWARHPHCCLSSTFLMNGIRLFWQITNQAMILSVLFKILHPPSSLSIQHWPLDLFFLVSWPFWIITVSDSGVWQGRLTVSHACWHLSVVWQQYKWLVGSCCDYLWEDALHPHYSTFTALIRVSFPQGKLRGQSLTFEPLVFIKCFVLW